MKSTEQKKYVLEEKEYIEEAEFGGETLRIEVKESTGEIGTTWPVRMPNKMSAGVVVALMLSKQQKEKGH